MKDSLKPFDFLSIKEAVNNSRVAFSIADLEEVCNGQHMNTNNQTFDERLPTISSESVAYQLIQSGVYSDISIAWEAVCRMRRFRAGMQES